MRALLVALLLAGSYLGLPRLAAAQPSSADDQEARALFEAGTVAFNEGRFDRALEHFERAYELSGRPPMLFNIGNVHDRLGHSQQALDYFRSYLAEVPDASNAAFVRGRISVLEGQVGPASADEEEQVGSSAAPGAERPAAQTGAGQSAGGDPVPGIALMAVGGVLVAASGGTLIWWIDRNDAIDRCNMLDCRNGRNLVSERDAAMGTTIALATIGLAALGVGIVLFVTAGDGGQGASVRCAPGLGGLACEGRF